MSKFLEIENLSVSVEGKQILKDINLEIQKGEIHVLMGPNGAGKSTLLNAIMAHPKYEVTSGKIHFEGEDITSLKADERAKRGIFMSFQTPEEINGVNIEEFLKVALNARGEDTGGVLKFHKNLEKKMQDMKMDRLAIERYVNVGFSGGEKKKSEVLQMSMLNPSFVMLDEIDSGLDVDAVKIVSQTVKDFFNKDKSMLIITHHKDILTDIVPDFVHILKEGQIVKTGDAGLIDKIEKDGYENL